MSSNIDEINQPGQCYAGIKLGALARTSSTRPFFAENI